MTSEKWVRVPSFGEYIVSDLGRVRHSRVNAPILKGSLDKDGYRRVSLGGCTLRVHAIVAEAFYGPRPEGFECAHLDGNKQNNAASNLAWVTRSENTRHQIEHGTFGGFGGVNVNSKLSDENVQAIRADAESGMGGRKLSKKYGINRSTAHRIVVGERRSSVPKADAHD